MRIVLDHTQDVAANIRSFWFRPEKKMDYLAGQFIELFLPHEGQDERGIKRNFSLSSSPTEELICITLKRAVGRSSTFKQMLFGLEMGTTLTMIEPTGDFVLPKDPRIPLVFVAGGIGITPVRGIVKWLSDTKEKRRVHIIYGARTLEEVAFRDIFVGYGAKLDIIISEQSGDWSGRAGSITTDLILDLTGKVPDPLFYISGPESLVESLEDGLHASGITGDRLVLDFFSGYRAV